ncbi:MAG TPA: L,D-transpeptidase family protein [Allosphingosinicella sp.]|jgi:hypothetical protein
MTNARHAIACIAATLFALAAFPQAAPIASAAPMTAVEPAEAPAPALPEPLPALGEPELAPGEFVWNPERAATGRVEIVVSIPLQRAYVYRGGTLIAVSTVSTGKKGHATPTGTFPILQKRPKHFSSLYNNAPMPFMQRLTWDGIALHAGQIPGHPASHGCVRLPLDFAKHLFGVTKIGATVHIVPHSPSAGEALATVRGGAGAYTGMGGPLEEIDTPNE